MYALVSDFFGGPPELEYVPLPLLEDEDEDDIPAFSRNSFASHAWHRVL